MMNVDYLSNEGHSCAEKVRKTCKAIGPLKSTTRNHIWERIELCVNEGSFVAHIHAWAKFNLLRLSFLQLPCNL